MIPTLHHILESENFRFPFSTKKCKLVSKICKIKFQQVVGNLLDKLRKLIALNGKFI